MHPTAMSNCMLVSESEKSGQCEYGNAVFEYVQIKTILICSLKPFTLFWTAMAVSGAC